MKQRNLVVGISLLIFLACVVVSSSFAWFTDQDIAVNKIELGNLGIELTESSLDNDATVNENGIVYADPLAPGSEKSKIVDIENTKDLDVFLRLTVTRSWVDKDHNEIDGLNPEMIQLIGVDDSLWLHKPSGHLGVDYYYLRKPLLPQAKVTLFTNFKLSPNITLDDNPSYAERQALIDVNALATQTLEEAVEEQLWEGVQVVDNELVSKP